MKSHLLWVGGIKKYPNLNTSRTTAGKTAPLPLLHSWKLSNLASSYSSLSLSSSVSTILTVTERGLNALKYLFDISASGGKCWLHTLIDKILARPINLRDFSNEMFQEFEKMKLYEKLDRLVEWQQFEGLIKTCTKLSFVNPKLNSENIAGSLTNLSRMSYFSILKSNVLFDPLYSRESESTGQVLKGVEQSCSNELKILDQYAKQVHSKILNAPDPTVLSRIEERMLGDGFINGEETDEEQMDLDEVEEILDQTQTQARFIPLTGEEIDHVASVFLPPSSNQTLFEKFSIPMTRRLIQCLKPGTWLNDEVINFYMCMLQERDEALCKQFPNRRSSHFYNSFFISKLLDADGRYNYNNVKRWSKKFNIFEKDKVFCPVNIGNSHWTLGVIYVQKKEIRYYDSMASLGRRFLDGMLNYMKDEAAKLSIPFNIDEWTVLPNEDTPQQVLLTIYEFTVPIQIIVTSEV